MICFINSEHQKDVKHLKLCALIGSFNSYSVVSIVVQKCKKNTVSWVKVFPPILPSKFWGCRLVCKFHLTISDDGAQWLVMTRRWFTSLELFSDPIDFHLDMMPAPRPRNHGIPAQPHSHQPLATLHLGFKLVNHSFDYVVFHFILRETLFFVLNFENETSVLMLYRKAATLWHLPPCIVHG